MMGTSLSQPSMPLDSDWVTAGILDRYSSRQFIGRLSGTGVDHQVIGDDGAYRILVPRESLDAALDLLPPPITKPTSEPKPSKSAYHRSLRLLVSLPVGGAIGSALALLLDLDYPYSNVAPSLVAVITAILVEVLWTRSGDAQSEDEGGSQT